MVTTLLVKRTYSASEAQGVSLFRVTNSFRTTYCVGVVSLDSAFGLAYCGPSLEAANNTFATEAGELVEYLWATRQEVHEYYPYA